MDISTACIVGSGLIGSCWAALFARAGLNVQLYDIDEGQVFKGLDAIRDIISQLSENGLLNDQTVDSVMCRIHGTTSLEEAVQDAEYIQECVPEKLELKQQIFKSLDSLANESCILASSTSCIAPSSFTEGLAHAMNCLVAHPVNPPHYIPVVEIVSAPWTSEMTVQRTCEFQKKLGQAPVVLRKEVNGFVINRLQYALLMEAWRLVEDGVATPEDIDTAISQGLGLRWSFMGVFETIDLNAPGGVSDYCDRYGESITALCKEQEDTRKIKGSETAAQINEAMRKRIPLEDIQAGTRRAWRDRRLAALAVHKHTQAKLSKDEKA
eukprot:gene5818-235_t